MHTYVHIICMYTPVRKDACDLSSYNTTHRTAHFLIFQLTLAAYVRIISDMQLEVLYNSFIGLRNIYTIMIHN